jgi:Fe-S oxidoreductase
MGADFIAALDARTAKMTDACTRCGDCFRVCPMPAAAGLDEADAEAVAGGVIDLLRRGKGTPEAERWAGVCSGSGFCIQACDEGVNMRFLLAMARLAKKREADAAVNRDDGVASFKQMSRGVRVLSQLQLPPDLLARVGRETEPRDTPPEMIFYTGCNIMKTPHIALHCLDVLDALGVDYRINGGPADCCGILQFRAGDEDNAGRQAIATIERFSKTGTSEVVSWCPTCQIQLGENLMPAYETAVGPAGFEMTMFAPFLARRLDALRPLLVNRVEKRVGLHEHPGTDGVAEAARELLEAIPGLDFIDLEQPRVGYMCNRLASVPEYRRDLHRMQLEAAAAAGVTTLAGIYHACHRDFCSHQRDWPFEIVNFMELIGESMGTSHPDRFKELKMMQDVDAILAEAAALIDGYGLDLDEAREVVLADLLGE